LVGPGAHTERDESLSREWSLKTNSLAIAFNILTELYRLVFV